MLYVLNVVRALSGALCLLGNLGHTEVNIQVTNLSWMRCMDDIVFCHVCVCASLEANKSPIQSTDTTVDRLLQEAANQSFRLSVRTPLSNIIKYYQMIVCFVLVRVGPSYSGEFGRPAVQSMWIHLHPLMQTWRSWNPHFTVPESQSFWIQG